MFLIQKLLQDPSRIVYLEGAGNYSWLYFQNGRKELLSKPLRYFETLPDDHQALPRLLGRLGWFWLSIAALPSRRSRPVYPPVLVGSPPVTCSTL